MRKRFKTVIKWKPLQGLRFGPEQTRGIFVITTFVTFCFLQDAKNINNYLLIITVKHVRKRTLAKKFSLICQNKLIVQNRQPNVPV